MENPKTSIQYSVVSPDGFTIERERTHSTPERAWIAFDAWKENYRLQGYYSTTNGNQRIEIPLDELREHCSMASIPSIDPNVLQNGTGKN